MRCVSLVALCAGAALCAASCRRPTAVRPTDTSTVSTLAGCGQVADLGGGYLDGPTLLAQFRHPAGLALDTVGNVYVADVKNQRVRVITRQGQVLTVGGGGSTGPIMGGYADGPAAEARFADPIGLCVGADGRVFVADSDNHRIRAISPQGVVSTVSGSGGHGTLLGGYADGPADAAQFSRPYDVVLGSDGDLYIADYFNHSVRRISADGQVSTLAGNGVCGHADGRGSVARLAYPNRIARDARGNLYVTEGHSRDMWEGESGNLVRKIAPDGTVTTVAGNGHVGHVDGPASDAEFDTPMGLDVDPQGNIYVADYLNHCIRVVGTDGQVRTLAGRCGVSGYMDGLATSSRFSYPMDVAVSARDRLLYVADYGNHRIRTITLPR